MAGEQADQQAGARAGIAHIQNVCWFGQAADTDAVNPPDAIRLTFDIRP